MLLRGLAHEGVHAFHAEYDAPLVGRARDLAALDAFARGQPPFGLLCAPAGRGKSALLVRFARELDARGERVAWLPISLRFGTHRGATVDDLLTARLRARLERQGHWRELLTTSEHPLLVLLDGLDELQDTAWLDALTGLTLPPGVRLLASARTQLDRDASAWTARLGWQPCAQLALDPLSLDEVRESLRAHPGVAAAEVMARTGGDPLLVRLCMESIYDGRPLPDVSDPAELVGAWWSAQRASLQGTRGEAFDEVLGALGAACGVVPREVLVAASGRTATEVDEVLAGLPRFVLEVPGRGLTFAHPRFAEIARWSLADATQRALRRYATLAQADRARPDPSLYFLHFALPHLDAVGAPDDAIHALLSRPSLEAWHRSEGGFSGFLTEARASWERAERAQRTTPADAPLAPSTLRRQSCALLLDETLRRHEGQISPALRAALYASGLRSLESTLRGLRAIDPAQDHHDHAGRSIQALLPCLPDASLPPLLALSSSWFWPFEEVAEHLRTRGLTSLALDHLLASLDGTPCRLEAEELARLAPDLTAPQRADAIGRFLERCADQPDALVPLLPLLPLLDAAPRAELLAQLQGRIRLSNQRHRFVCQVDWLEAQLRLGEIEGACSTLASLVNDLNQGHVSSMDAEVPVRLLSQAWVQALPGLSLLEEGLRALLEAIPSLSLWFIDGWCALLTRRPETTLSPAQRTQLLDAIVGREPRMQLPAPLPGVLEQHLLVQVTQVKFLRDTVKRGKVLRLLARHRLDDTRSLRRELPDWRAQLRDEPTRLQLARVMLRQREGLGDDVVQGYLDELADEGSAVWEIDGWEEFFSPDRRRALLERHLARPLMVFYRYAFGRTLADALRSPAGLPSTAQENLIEAIHRLGDLRIEGAPAVVATLPAAEQRAYVARLLEEHSPVPADLLSELALATHDLPTRRALVAYFLDHLSDFGRDWYLDHAKLFAWPALLGSLPPEEAEAAQRTFAAWMRAHGRRLSPTGRPTWARFEAWKNVHGALDEVLSHAEQLCEPGVYDEPAQAVVAALRTMRTTPGRLRFWSPRAFATVAPSMTAEALLALMQVETPGDAVTATACAQRALTLIEQGSPLTSELIALISSLPPSLLLAEREDQLRLDLWRARASSPAEKIRRASDWLEGWADRFLLGPLLIDVLRGHGVLVGVLQERMKVLQNRAPLHGSPEDASFQLLAAVWSRLTDDERSLLLADLEYLAWRTTHRESLEQGADELSGELLRARWTHEFTARRQDWWMPVAWLQSLGGDEALVAWTEGLLDAMMILGPNPGFYLSS